jgi:hypothetical protein
MGKKCMSGCLVVVLALAGFHVATAGAAPPWENLLTFKRVEADPEKSYRLTRDNGPGLIIASTFSGEGADEQARELVLELRRRYKLPAYVHKMRFDLGRDVGGRGIDRYGEPIRWRHQSGPEIAETAVLVGDYPSVDDPRAKEILQTLKYARPECLKIGGGKKTHQSLASLRQIQRAILKSGNSKKKKGPMNHAFIAPNPLVPKGEIVPRGLDPLVVKMNKGIKHSLLNCPGKYTVQVAHFTGKVIVDQQEIQRIEKGKRMKQSRLDEAAEKAHKLAKALRLKGWEAYEFHDRYASLVTVGSFESAGTPRRDGKIEINPKIHRIMESFKGKQPATGGPVAAQLVVGIPLDLQPIPVRVPKQSIAAPTVRRTAAWQ